MFRKLRIEDNGLNIENWDATIYRVIPMHRFIQLINTQKNGLVNPARWDDPFENFFLKNNAVASDGTPISLRSISESWYGQCWTFNEDSDAMWRIYSPGKNGVRISTTIRKIFSSFYDTSDKFASLKFLIGTVSYVDKQEFETFLTETTFTNLALGGQPHEFAKTLLMKRPEFSHEKEVRLLFHDAENNKGKGGVALFKFPWQTIIQEIALDPRLAPSTFISEKQKLVSLGCTLPVYQSDLYKFTPTSIRIG